MILVDSSVWIDYFRGAASAETGRLDTLLGVERLLIGDLMLTEVLQGFATDRAFTQALQLLSTLETVEIGGREVIIAAALNFRTLRALGITVRKTIDTLIATRCLRDGLSRLFADRDFRPVVEHLGLVSAMEPR